MSSFIKVSSDDENSMSTNSTHTYFTNETDEKDFFDHNYSDDNLECVCGKKIQVLRVLECHKCGLKQHAKCVLAKPDVSGVNYLCPYCWVDPSTVRFFFIILFFVTFSFFLSTLKRL